MLDRRRFDCRSEPMKSEAKASWPLWWEWRITNIP